VAPAMEARTRRGARLAADYSLQSLAMTWHLRPYPGGWLAWREGAPQRTYAARTRVALLERLAEMEPERRPVPPELSAVRAEAGRLGGLATTEAKLAAARANGRRGGRPRKDVKR
jgi:hypothetical protein